MHRIKKKKTTKHQTHTNQETKQTNKQNKNKQTNKQTPPIQPKNPHPRETLSTKSFNQETF